MESCNDRPWQPTRRLAGHTIRGRFHPEPVVDQRHDGAAAAPAKEHDETAGRGGLFSGRTTSLAGYVGTTPTELIGRSRDLERLAAVMAAPDAGLVTVTGPAGVGKSRLVMEFLRWHGAGLGGPVEVLDFGQSTDPSVSGLLLRQLREQIYESPPALRSTLERVGAGRNTLLIDHFEDVADELAPLLAELRRCFPQIRIVSVGTARLGLYGERVVRLGPLPTGDTAGETEGHSAGDTAGKVPGDPAGAELPAVARIPAVELFVQCARSVRPEFTLTAENLHSVLSLCRLLGGLPFAIELAASQVSLAEPDLILERFERGAGDLRRIGHHPYSRHSSIGDLVTWVFTRLRIDERIQLNQLAVFEGPFTARAAAGVLEGFDGGSYRIMERLIDKSVLVPDVRQDGELSLSIPSAVRLAAARSLARLPGYPSLQRAHAEYFRGVAEARATGEPAVAGAGGRPWPGPDLRADLLAAFGHWREAGDGRAMAVIVNALWEKSTGAARGRQCLRLAEEVLRTGVDDPRLHARTLEAAGDTAMRLGSATARGYLTHARDVWRAVQDEEGMARCLGLLGDEAYAAGDLDRARARLEEGLAVLAANGRATSTGDGASAVRGHLTRRLAVVLREAGSLARAAELARTALAADLGRADFGGAVLARYLLSTIRWLEQDSPEVRALFADAAEQVGGLPEVAERPECLEMLAIASWKWRRITDWRLLTAVLGLADRLRRRLGLGRPRPLDEMITPILAVASQELTADAYAWAWRSAAELRWDAALRLVSGDEPTAGAVREVPTDVVDLLTKRELEVALLVAEGLTNRVIARELGIAEWTVVNHLRKVMRKFGCQSRVQVTRRLVTP